MIKLRQAIVVEGRYDRAKVSGIFDAPIIETGGFNLFHSEDAKALIRRFAEGDGIVILTDSDAGGRKIRAYIMQLVGEKAKVFNAYIPQIEGKERRKNHPGSAGLLGVEGVPNSVIERCVLEAVGESGETVEDSAPAVTMADLYAAGLTGRQDSAAKRALFLRQFSLPEDLTPKLMLRYLSSVLGNVNFRKKLTEFAQNGGESDK